MKISIEQRSVIDGFLRVEPKEESINLDTVVERYAKWLKGEYEAGRLRELLPELAHAHVRQRAAERRWEPTVEDAKQGSLFDPGALLTLGENEAVPMADAKGHHLLRHQTILNENLRRVVEANAVKTQYIASRVPLLFERDCTLGVLEAETDKEATETNEEATEEAA